MKSAAVSVVMPVYNGERFLAESIQSVLDQSFSDLELIIVNDDSEDASDRIVRQFRDKRIKYFENERNLGLVGNWNRCFELATSDYVTMLHQDDVMLPENVERKVQILSSTPYRWVASNCLQIDEHGKRIHEEWFRHPIALSVAQKSQREKFDRMFFESNYICFCTVMWERSLLREAGEFKDDAGYCTDVQMWLRTLTLADLCYIPVPLIKYRWAQNVSLRNDNDDWFFENYLARKAIVEELKLGFRYRAFLRYVLGFGCLHRALVSYCRGNRGKARKMISGLGHVSPIL